MIFSSQLNRHDVGYAVMSAKMVALAQTQPGFLGMESARDEGGFGITVSYWESLESITNWKNNAEHQIAQQQGLTTWYASFSLRIAKVVSHREFSRQANE